MYDFQLFSGQKYMVQPSPKIYIVIATTRTKMITLISNLTSNDDEKIISPERIKLSLSALSTRQLYRFSQLRKKCAAFIDL